MARGTSWGPRLDPPHPEARGTSDPPPRVFSWHRFWIYIPLPHSQGFFCFTFFLSFVIGVRFYPPVVVSYIFWYFFLIYLLAFTIYFLLCYCSVYPPLFILFFFSGPGGFQGLFMGWRLGLSFCGGNSLDLLVQVWTAGLTENVRPQGILIRVRYPRSPHLNTKTWLCPAYCKLHCWKPQSNQLIRQEHSPTHQEMRQQ